MQLKAKINKLWVNITGHASQFPLETRIFHSLCVIATIALGYNVPFNYLIGLQVVSLMSFVAMLFFMLLYYRSRYHGKVNSSLVIFALTGNILFIFNYIYNSGTNGPTDLLMGLCIMLVLCVAPKRQQRFWVALNLLIIIGLHALEYFQPNVIPDTYVSRRARYIDVTSAYVVFVFVLYYTIAYLRRNYDFEKNSAANKAIAIERQNAEMTHVNHELARINTERNKLLSIIAHDLRSPLGNIQNYLELVNDNELDSDDRRSVESNLLNVTRGTIEMLGKMLMWSKAQMDGVNVKLGYINLSDALYNTVELEKSLAAKKSITFNVDLDWGARIVADSDMLQLIIRNLLNNAIKFTPNGGIISFKAKQIGAECWLIIRDNGVGIPESMHAGLFSFQGSPTLGTENEKGVGLGLVLCKEFTELQGGRIWLECPEEGGTVSMFRCRRLPDSLNQLIVNYKFIYCIDGIIFVNFDNMRPGDKVICINDKIDPDKSEEIRRDFEIWITKDKEYTIREILDNDGIVTGVLLEEVHNFPKFFQLINRYQEPAFAIWRFRKLNYNSAPAEAVSEVEELVSIEEDQLVKTN